MSAAERAMAGAKDAGPGTRTFINVAAHLPEQARRAPDGTALLFADGRRVAFGELDANCDRLARGLEQIGIQRGTRTVLMVPPSPDFFALTFALFKIGAVPVLVDPGLGVKRLGRCLDEAAPAAFIGVPKAQLARRLLGWAKRHLEIVVTAGRPRLGGRSLDEARALGESPEPYEMTPTSPDEPAAILFTSGSTGSPKGALYTHGIFSAQVAMLRETYGIETGEVDLPTFPLFALFDPALGMTAVIPEMDFTRPGQVVPNKILGPIREHEITNMFGSPALLDRVGRAAVEMGVKLPSLRRVLSAGAPASPAILERFQSLLKEPAEVFTPYGATEALPVASIGSRELLEETRTQTERGAGICVGRPVSGIEVAIVETRDEAIRQWSEDLCVPRGEIGEIVVRGPVVTKEYFARPEATRLAKIEDPESGAVRHRMGDLGYLDALGRLWFCGRKAHRVETPKGALYTICCERVFDGHPAVKRTALVGVGECGAQKPVLCVELERQARRLDKQRLAEELLEIGERHEVTRDIRTLLFHPSFPVDIRHNAKIFREWLARWAARQLR